MADGISIDVQGLDAIKAKLDSLTKQAGDRAIRTALRAGAEIVQAEVALLAPVKDSGGYLPRGALKQDIVVKMSKDDHGQPVALIQPGKISRFAALLTEYGHRLIRGGRSRLLANGKGKGPGKQIGTVAAHPFIRPAYEASQKAAADAICSTLAAEVTKAASKSTNLL